MWLREETIINATPKKVFDLSRDIDLHLEHGKEQGEIVVEGRTSGLMLKGESVTWEAKHLGLRQRMTVTMDEALEPSLLITRMTKGPFAHFVHYHRILPDGDGTRLVDDLFIKAPFGIFGFIAEFIFLKRYFLKFIRIRNAHLKKSCEENNVV